MRRQEAIAQADERTARLENLCQQSLQKFNIENGQSKLIGTFVGPSPNSSGSGSYITTDSHWQTKTQTTLTFTTQDNASRASKKTKDEDLGHNARNTNRESSGKP